MAEGTVKPASALTFAQTLAPVQTIANTTKVSVQSLTDVPALQAWIDARLSYAVLLAAENLFLNATPDGLLANATALDPTLAPPVPNTQLDQVAARPLWIREGTA